MVMNIVEKVKNHWTIWIFSLIVGSISLYWNYESRRHELGGTLNASIQSRMLNSKGTRTIVVCMEDADTDLSKLNITPTFDNPSKFSLKDFSLSFEVKTENVELVPTSFYTVHQYNNNQTIYRYNDNTLPAYEETKTPFLRFCVQDNLAKCAVKAKATYDTAPSAFEYSTDVWFIVEKKGNMSVESWKMNCKKRISNYINASYYDVYYFASGIEPEFQLDITLTSPSKGMEIETNSQAAVDNVELFIENKTANDFSPKAKVEPPVQTATGNFDNAVLSVNGYKLSQNNTYTKLTFQLSDPPVEKGIYLLCFNAYTKDSQDKSLNYESITRIEAGDTTINFFSGILVDSISDCYLYPTVITNQYAKEKIKDGKLLITNTSDCMLSCAVIYSENSTYFCKIVPGGTIKLNLGDVYYLFSLGKTDTVDKEKSFLTSYYSMFLGESVSFFRLILASIGFCVALLGTCLLPVSIIIVIEDYNKEKGISGTISEYITVLKNACRTFFRPKSWQNWKTDGFFILSWVFSTIFATISWIIYSILM